MQYSYYEVDDMPQLYQLYISRKNGNTMCAHTVELKKATVPCSSGTARAFRQRVKARRAAQGRTNQQPENLYGVLIG